MDLIKSELFPSELLFYDLHTVYYWRLSIYTYISIFFLDKRRRCHWIKWTTQKGSTKKINQAKKWKSKTQVRREWNLWNWRCIIRRRISQSPHDSSNPQISKPAFCWGDGYTAYKRMGESSVIWQLPSCLQRHRNVTS